MATTGTEWLSLILGLQELTFELLPRAFEQLSLIA
jgi:hypothetical protein